jgi:hypothetical protein
VTVLHDADHPSRLVLPRVPNDDERIDELAECGLVIRQPCRPDPLAAAAADGGTSDGSSDGAPASGDPSSSDETTGRSENSTGSLPATGGATPWALAATILLVGLVARRLT